MIFISTAMYWEASPFIEKFNLKKDSTSYKFQIFKNQDILLIIMGIGKVKAAIATTYLFSKYPPKPSDLFINIGVCGSKNFNIPIGSVFLCNKIIENDTKKTFYPDVILRHPFKETSVETFSTVINKSDIVSEGELIDMEASGIYQAASVFLQPHQIFFIKIISDYLKGEKIKEKDVSKLIEDKSTEIINWIHKIKFAFLDKESIFSKEEEYLVEDISNNLKLSSTMKNQFKQLLIYYKLQYKDFSEVINNYKNVECKSKNEGKRFLAELKEKLI